MSGHSTPEGVTPPRDSPGVVVLPPLLFGGALAAGLVLHWLAPLPLSDQSGGMAARVAGVLLVIVATLLGRWGEVTMRRAGTNVRPDRPTLALVTGGPFRYSRNPLYVALTMLYVGVALLFGALWPLVLLVPVLGVLRWGIVAREERYLAAKFGDAYRAYVARVRRWV
jgi:protein-S-isoprenylcysteine O-methyltransferase Ste14